jgi:DNA-binding beta-propeller fold protein YncE
MLQVHFPRGGNLPRFFYLTVFLLPILDLVLLAQDGKEARQIPLPSSKVLTTPVPGHIGSLSGFPVTAAVSPDKRYAAFLNDGYGAQANLAHQSIAILDLNSNQITDFPDSRLPQDAHQSYFIGLAFSADGTHLYASMGSITDAEGKNPGSTGNGIAVYGFHEGKVGPERFIKLKPQKIARGRRVASALKKTKFGTAIPYPAGLAVIPSQRKDKSGSDLLVVANNLSDNVVVLDSKTGRELKRFDLSVHSTVPASFPHTVIASSDGRRAWCSLWNLSRIAELDLQKGTVAGWIPLLQPQDPIASGSHPTAMLLTSDEKFLFVALSNADRVAAVSTASGKVVRWFDTAVAIQKFAGTSPNALALSKDGTRLFVADAAINAVAVFDTAKLSESASEASHTRALGFIPTEWYPTALAVVATDLLIATAKGRGTGPNNFAGATESKKKSHDNAYIPTLLYGSLARLKLAEIETRLHEFTERVEQDEGFRGDPGKIEFAQGKNPIRHVIYILKENRTYDQILGDLQVGNGDPSLVMYGADITPNQHKLALEFGVIDNFYDSGEVSGDGHEWSMAAITSDYNEKTWQITYRGKERTYDYQGAVADEYPLLLGQPDVDAPATGYIWDNVAAHGLTYRNYGEFMGVTWCEAQRKNSFSPKPGTPSPVSANCDHPVINKGELLPSNVGQPHGSPSPWPWPIPMLQRTQAVKAAWRDHFDPLFPDFNTQYPDQLRADEFLNEFEGFVRARQEGQGTELPQFVLLYLPDDHTHGTQAGMPRPAASVADNDLAVGRVVEAVSNSPYWDDTAILILEDDAQDGADHVDAHRSTAYLISKYSPGSSTHPFVDSRFYTTVNLIHTIEALLNLPPMNQNDAYAPVMAPLFTGPGTQPPFKADWRNRDNGLIYEMNPPHAPGSAESAKMDWGHPDAVNTALLNKILWYDRKGKQPMPPPRHTLFPAEAEKDDD